MCDTKINDIIKGHNKRDMMKSFVDSVCFFYKRSLANADLKKGF